MELPNSVRTAIQAGPVATIITLGATGAPQVSMAWIGLDGDEVVLGSLFDQPKLRNLRRDERIAVVFQPGGLSAMGLPAYVVLHGRARVTDGGGAELVGQLANTYIGPGVVYPPIPNPPAGWVTHITVDRITGSEAFDQRMSEAAGDTVAS